MPDAAEPTGQEPEEVIVAEPLIAEDASVELVGTEVLAEERPAKTANPQLPPRRKPRSYRKDATLLDAVDEARQAALTVARQTALGEHLGAQMVGERLASHSFACLERGYPGWHWEVTVARAPRSKKVTICEIELAPGPEALLAPEWVPWRDRLEPGDISRSDVLPYQAHDARLQSGFEDVDDTDAELAGLEDLGHGRKRVLSQYGLDLAADRWYDSPHGPVPGVKPNAMCATCGFLIKIQGTMGTLFGVCGNEWSPDDGTVVSFDHSCGAHSETDQPKQRSQWPIVPSRLDDEEIDFEEF